MERKLTSPAPPHACPFTWRRTPRTEHCRRGVTGPVGQGASTRALTRAHYDPNRSEACLERRRHDHQLYLQRRRCREYSRCRRYLRAFSTSDGSSTGNSEILLRRERPVYEVLFTPGRAWSHFRGRECGCREGDLGYVDLETGIVDESLLVSEFNEKGIALSPRRTLVAYVSDVTGGTRCSCVPFPTLGGGRIQVSTGAGQEPVWRTTDASSFYRESAEWPDAGSDILR